MGTFHLRARDTRPILEVGLLNPDGTPHDLTGSTAWKLHIKLPSGTVLTRDMTKQGPDTDGVLRYIWVATDWEPVNPADPKLPVPQSAYHTVELPMEYEVIAGSTTRMTFPNGDGHDKLQIRGEIGQG